MMTGKEALIALANGEEVEYWCENDPSIQKRWTPIKALSDYKLSYFLENKPRFEFRLKPRTISINGIELPAPFEPKDGEDCRAYVIDTRNVNGYDWQHSSHYKSGYIVWRTEEEVKQVIAALRIAFKPQ